MLRKNKIDLNLIIDLNPTLLKSNIAKFINEVKSVDNLNIFINGLTEKPSKEKEFLIPSSPEDLIK